MYNNVLQGIEHIAIWPVISFVIFFIFFLCLLWYVVTVDPEFIQQMKNMPIQDASETDEIQKKLDIE